MMNYVCTLMALKMGCASGQSPRDSYLDENGDWLDFVCDEESDYGSEIPIDWVQDGWDDCGDSDGDGVADDEDAYEYMDMV